MGSRSGDYYAVAIGLHSISTESFLSKLILVMYIDGLNMLLPHMLYESLFLLGELLW